LIQENSLPKRNSKSLRLLGSFQKDFKHYPMRKSYIRFHANILQEKYQLKWKTSKYLIKSYGERAFDIMLLTKEDESLRDPINLEHPYIKVIKLMKMTKINKITRRKFYIISEMKWLLSLMMFC
jgi:hypothetical protein